jgi:hypothetical protein
MLMFKYYVTSLHDGEILGLDDDEDAANLAGSEDYFVVDTSTGEWLLADGTRQAVRPFTA